MTTTTTGAAVMTGTLSSRSPGAKTQDLTTPCQRQDADLWFAELPQDVEAAKNLCGDCPLRQSCLEGARRRREPWGVWGGELFSQGEVVPRKRPRGRPRKSEVAA